MAHGAAAGIGNTWTELLTADGNKVYRPTLTGHGEHSNLASTNIDLDTHIQDIVNVILWENLHNVVLVGHSYGGMVITGVADRVPGRIKRVVYIDALLPENGERENDIRARTGITFHQRRLRDSDLGQKQPAAAARRAAIRTKPSANPSS